MILSIIFNSKNSIIMKNKIKMQLNLMLVLSIIFGSTTGIRISAQYILTDADVVVTNGIIESCSYGFGNKDIIIPEILDGQTVTGIGNDYKKLFYDKGISSVQFPSGLITIGESTFANNNITQLTIPSSIKSIGNFAFFNNRLTKVLFEHNSSIISIENLAFHCNDSELTITLPTHANENFINYVGGDFFYGPGDIISSFTSFYYANIPYTLTDDDVVVTNGIIESCSYDFTCKTIIIPDTLDGQRVIGIGDDYENLFYNKSIVNVQLPSGLYYIGDCAFQCNLLLDITIPPGVFSIGDYAFYNNRLVNVTIPEKVSLIGHNAFSYNDLADVTFKSNRSFIKIGNNAFAHNTNLGRF